MFYDVAYEFFDPHLSQKDAARIDPSEGIHSESDPQTSSEPVGYILFPSLIFIIVDDGSLFNSL